MIARALRALMLLQVLAMLALAWQMHEAGLPWPLAGLLGLAAVLAARALVVARNIWHSRRAEAGQADRGQAAMLAALAPLPPWQAVRLFGGELRSNLWTSSWCMLRPRLVATPTPKAGLVPVLLVHGYVCNRGFWSPMSAALAKAGVLHDAVDLEPVAGSIDQFVPLVMQAIEALRVRSGSAQVVIVAHSMGGLVARACLALHGQAAVAHVITIGTPHHGTALANLGVGRNARQMSRPGGQPSDWLVQLAASETPARRAMMTSIWSRHDNIVAPQISAELPGARNVVFDGIGHVALAFDMRVQQAVLSEITIVSEAAVAGFPRASSAG